MFSPLPFRRSGNVRHAIRLGSKVSGKELNSAIAFSLLMAPPNTLFTVHGAVQARRMARENAPKAGGE